MKIERINQEAQSTVYIRIRTNQAKLTEDFNANYAKILAYLAEIEEKPIGAPYAAYYNSDMEDLDTEMGFPVLKALPETDEIKFREIPAFEQAVSAVHKGSYSTLNETFKEVYQYIAENNLAMAGAHYDFYINDPDETPEDELVTKVVIPVSSEPVVYCQSCGMPMDKEELFGTENNGSKSEDYCVYCRKDGDFTADVSMDEMIDISLGHMKEIFANDQKFNADEALQNMRNFFPMLKRWKN